MPDTLPMKDKIALITGASRGIGAAVARAYAGLGAHVVLVARTVGGLEEVDDAIQRDGKGRATLVPMDLRQLESIDQLALTISERFGKLDILVGNAGVLGGLRPVTHFTNKIWDNVMTLNLTANWRLLRACDPLLRRAEHGRVIFVTSGVTKMDAPYWGAYAASKSALETLVRTYAAETENRSVRANLIDPGVVRSKMRSEAFPGENPDNLPAPESVIPVFVELASDGCKKHGQIVTAYKASEAA